MKAYILSYNNDEAQRFFWVLIKLDGVGPIDKRPNQLHHFFQKNKKKQIEKSNGDT